MKRLAIVSVLLFFSITPDAFAGVSARVSVQRVFTDPIVGNGNTTALQLEVEPFSIKRVRLGLEFRKESIPAPYDGYGLGLYLSRTWPVSRSGSIVTRLGGRTFVPTEHHSRFEWSENAEHQVTWQRSTHIMQAINLPLIKLDQDARNSTAIGLMSGVFFEHRLAGKMKVRFGTDILFSRFGFQEAKYDSTSGRLKTVHDRKSLKVIFAPSISIGF